MTIKEGAEAPYFRIQTHHDTTFDLGALQGKKVIIFFYPKDNTTGCTEESCDFRDMHARLKAMNVEIIGISKDSIASHKKFSEKFDLPFPLGADETLAVLKAYEVWVEKSLYGKTYMGIERATFLIDEAGKIEKIWRRVKVKNHVNNILEYLGT